MNTTLHLEPGFFHQPDATPVTILDEDGEPIFHGVSCEAEVYMEANGLRPHCNCEVVEDTDYVAGWIEV